MDTGKRFIERGGRWWALTTINALVAVLNSGNTREGRVYDFSDGSHGFTFEVYPDEAARYQHNLNRACGAPVKLLGSFRTPEEAYVCLEHAVGRKGVRN